MEIVLTIAGSDPSGGAGIQQDLKVITAHGCYGATVITALTSQNTQGVQSSMPVPPDVVASQLQAVLSDLHLSAIKIGMIPDKAVAQVIVEALKEVQVPIIYDPVMISTSGYQLMSSDAINYIAEQLFPLCTLVTPNLPESSRGRATERADRASLHRFSGEGRPCPVHADDRPSYDARWHRQRVHHREDSQPQSPRHRLHPVICHSIKYGPGQRITQGHISSKGFHHSSHPPFCQHFHRSRQRSITSFLNS